MASDLCQLIFQQCVEHVVWYVVSHLKAPSVKIVPLHNSFVLHYNEQQQVHAGATQYNALDSEARKHSKISVARHVMANLVLVPDFV